MITKYKNNTSRSSFQRPKPDNRRPAVSRPLGQPVNRPASAPRSRTRPAPHAPRPSARGGNNRRRRPSNGDLPAHFSLGSIQASKLTAGSKPPAPVSKAAPDRLRIIPLGGCEEVGRNMTAFEYGNDIVLLDMGLQFPDEDMLGIDYIIPNVEYLKGKERNIRGVIFSHGHLDHIGAAPILLEKLGNPPIIGMNLTLAMVKHKVEDYKPNSSKLLKTILIKGIDDRIQLGVFKISFFQIEHSIMDAVGVALSTPCGTVIHPGDWTMERGPDGEPLINYAQLAKLPRPTMLMLESLGAISTKVSPTAETLRKNLHDLISKAPGRIIIGTFASQVERIGWIVTMSEQLGKKVALEGYSMKFNTEIARELGYIKARKDTFIKIDQVGKFDDNKVVIICTGAQGEENAALTRIIQGAHRNIRIQKNDTIVLSSSIIPGNEVAIQRLKDNLYRQCDNVIHGSLMDIHISGHGNRDDIAYFLKTIKPDYYIPIYAWHFMLKEAEKLAQNLGFNPKRIIVPDNGMVIEFDKNGLRSTKEKVPANYVFVDGMGVTEASNNVVLRDRKMMSEDGMIVIITTIDSKTGDMIGSPDIISRGFVYMKENQELIQKARQKIRTIIKNRPHPQPGVTEDDYLKNKLRMDIGQFLFQETRRRPLLLPVLIRV